MRFLHCPRCGEATRPQMAEGRERDACTACARLWYDCAKPCATALIEDAAGRVLLVRRAVSPYRGLWNLPGGFLEAEEHPEAGAVRETLEETGFAIALTGLLGVYMDYWDGGGDPTRANHSLSVCYTARITGGAFHANEESDAIAWHAPDDMPEPASLAYANHRRALADWVRLKASTNPG